LICVTNHSAFANEEPNDAQIAGTMRD